MPKTSHARLIYTLNNKQVTYSVYLNTRLLQYSNGPQQSNCQMVLYSDACNVYSIVQMAIQIPDYFVRYSNGSLNPELLSASEYQTI